MEMCYDGALVMPSKFVVVDENEMVYVEGGIGTRALGNILDGVLTVALFAFSIYAGIRTIGALLANNAKGLVIGATSLALKRAGLSLAATVVNGLYSILTQFTNYSIGYGIACGLDRIDKIKRDGKVAF